ncbi:MAG: amylo-alpha-1,6-glucosidase [Anaerolineae bacterium]
MLGTEYAELIQRAQHVLQINDLGSFTKPASRQYPHQWNWDSAFIAIGLLHTDAERARQEIRSLLQGQWQNGMVSHIVFHHPSPGYFPEPGFWQTERCPNAPADVRTSGITQPPILATAVRAIHQRAPNAEFLSEVYPSLLAWHRWLFRERDPLGEGLVCIVHPWESGMDNSPLWVEVLARITPTDLPAYRRRDIALVSPDERPTDVEYDRYVYLVDLGGRAWWDQGEILARSPFLVQDVLFNAILHRANEDLRALAVELGEPTEEIDGWLMAMREAFTRKFWDEGRGLFLDYDVRNRQRIPENTIATFAPLYAGLAGEGEARRLVDEHLLNPTEYAPDGGSRYFVPTASKDGAHWDGRCYLRGPVWVNGNWLVVRGLQRCGYPEVASQIRRQTLELVAAAGFREYFDPGNGEGCGASNFSWSAALVIDLLMNPG